MHYNLRKTDIVCSLNFEGYYKSVKYIVKSIYISFFRLWIMRVNGWNHDSKTKKELTVFFCLFEESDFQNKMICDTIYERNSDSIEL